MWDGSLDSTHDIIIGNMQELCLRVWLVSTYESVRWGIIIEKCKNPCNTCFNWAARDWDCMVGNDLAVSAILLIIDAQMHHVCKAWILAKLCKGDWLFVCKENNILQAELLRASCSSSFCLGVFTHP